MTTMMSRCVNATAPFLYLTCIWARAALKIPSVLGYALFRYFHKPSSGVMVPTQGVLRMLEQRGFKNLRSWTHGVDTELFAYQP